LRKKVIMIEHDPCGMFKSNAQRFKERRDQAGGMNVSTFSVIVGDPARPACQAKCEFCVSKMTYSPDGFNSATKHSIDYVNLKKACRIASAKGVVSALLTGKGEPTLYPEEIEFYLMQLDDYFPLIDLQTNGILLEGSRLNGEGSSKITSTTLKNWRYNGLSTIAISMVHFNPQRNAEIYGATIDLAKLVEYLRGMGFSIRLCCVLMKGNISNWGDVKSLISFAKTADVQQLTIRPVRVPLHDLCRNEEVYRWCADHALSEDDENSIFNGLESEGHYLTTLAHGAPVYDVNGQNICMADCLPIDKPVGSSIQMIYWPDGRIRYDWQFAGSVLL
jgi:hypothetical protein